MGQKLPPEQMALYNRIDEILWNDWDPIGVSRMENWPRDGYYAYLPHVFSLALHNAAVEEIATYLHKVTTERMSLGSSVSSHILVAEKILAARAVV